MWGGHEVVWSLRQMGSSLAWRSAGKACSLSSSLQLVVCQQVRLWYWLIPHVAAEGSAQHVVGRRKAQSPAAA